MNAWIKRYWRSIIVVFCCLLAIGGVISVAILGKAHASKNNTPQTVSEQQKDNNENATPSAIESKEPNDKVYTLMDLGSRGCVPCDNLQPVLASLRSKYEGKINVEFYDVARTTEGAALATQYKIQYMPTLIFLDENGKEVKRVIGFQSQEQLEASFRQLGWIE